MLNSVNTILKSVNYPVTALVVRKIRVKSLVTDKCETKIHQNSNSFSFLKIISELNSKHKAVSFAVAL